MMYSKKSVHNDKLILGYTTKEHLLIDLDNTNLQAVIALTNMIIETWHDVGDALIVQSSQPKTKPYLKWIMPRIFVEKWPKGSYHIVFNNNIGYEKCCEIINCLADLDILSPELKHIREFRGDMTLRVSPRAMSHGIDPQPQPKIYVVDNHIKKRDYRINEYLNLWRITKKLYNEVI